MGGDPMLVLSLYQDIILRLGSRFSKAHRQATKLLLEKQKIGFDTILGLFGQWDVEYGLVSRPKSDIVCRIIARSFRWHAADGSSGGTSSRCLWGACAGGWLVELAERVMQVAGEKSGD